MDVSVVIPTLERGPLLLETLRQLLGHRSTDEIIVVDQTAEQPREVREALEGWNATGEVRWLRLTTPSIPLAMNAGLLATRHPVVLYLDDDIILDDRTVERHRIAYEDAAVVGVVGQVLQPGESVVDRSGKKRGRGLWRDLNFLFNSNQREEIANCIACNLSVRKDAALSAGGFDENFKAVAFRFETEFCRRLIRNGGKILFEPSARIRHLKTPRGGTRVHGDRMRTTSPAFSVGDYYFAFREGTAAEVFTYALYRLYRESRSRFYLTRPWWLPARWIGELRGLGEARKLARRGPRLLDRSRIEAALVPGQGQLV